MKMVNRGYHVNTIPWTSRQGSWAGHVGFARGKIIKNMRLNAYIITICAITIAILFATIANNNFYIFQLILNNNI